MPTAMAALATCPQKILTNSRCHNLRHPKDRGRSLGLVSASGSPTIINTIVLLQMPHCAAPEGGCGVETTGPPQEDEPEIE